MLDKAQEWLQRHWWGIIIAHLFIIVTVFLVIWNFAEPVGIPDNIEQFPSVFNTRIFLHVVLTLLISAYITLFLDLQLRRANEKKPFISVHKALIGTWRGNYTNYSGKERRAVISIQEGKNGLFARIKTYTEQGEIVQDADVQDILGRSTFVVSANSVTVKRERNLRWRPEIWKCELYSNEEQNDYIIARIIDFDSNQIEREAAKFTLYKSPEP